MHWIILVTSKYDGRYWNQIVKSDQHQTPSFYPCSITTALYYLWLFLMPVDQEYKIIQNIKHDCVQECKWQLKSGKKQQPLFISLCSFSTSFVVTQAWNLDIFLRILLSSLFHARNHQSLKLFCSDFSICHFLSTTTFPTLSQAFTFSPQFRLPQWTLNPFLIYHGGHYQIKPLLSWWFLAYNSSSLTGSSPNSLNININIFITWLQLYLQLFLYMKPKAESVL